MNERRSIPFDLALGKLFLESSMFWWKITKTHRTDLKLYCYNCLSSLLLHKKMNPDSFRFPRSHDKPPKLPPRDSALYGGGGGGGHPASTFSQASAASNSIWAQVKGGGNKGKGTGGGKRPGGFIIGLISHLPGFFSCETKKNTLIISFSASGR